MAPLKRLSRPPGAVVYAILMRINGEHQPGAAKPPQPAATAPEAISFSISAAA